MRILHSYILKEARNSFILSFIVFTFILITGNLIKLADLVINKGVNILLVGKLFFFLLPSLLTYTVPTAVLVSVLLTFGYLSANNEITAIRCSGFALYRLLPPLIIVGIIISLFLVILENHLIPWSHFAARKTVMEIGMRKPTSCLEAGRFIKEFKGYIIFIYEIKENRLKHIRVYQPQEKRKTRIIIAREGILSTFFPEEGKVILKLFKGSSEEQDPVDPDKFYRCSFKEYPLILTLPPELKNRKIEKKIKDMNIKELKEEIKRLRKKGIPPIPLIAEIQRKFSFSFSTLAFIIIGFPLGIISRREEKSVGFGTGLIVLLFYYLLTAMAKGIVISKDANPYFWMWLPNIVVISVGLFLTYLTAKK
ncbi:MAG: hypothetical protein DRP75_02280 [Candidatus Omnitrophota bacterium]|nr:MAG: hypothetical protein DRP75_02280 [Candidatus Omnitrophota bacterium]